MDPKELYGFAEEILLSYRDLLAIDPFVRVTIEIADIDSAAQCNPDKSPLSWKITLNSNKHSDIVDIQYSIVESLLSISFADFNLLELDLVKFNEIKGRVISKLTYAICKISEPQEEVEDED